MSAVDVDQTSAQPAEHNNSAATSVNGSTAATETTTNTDISSTAEESSIVTSQSESVAMPKPASAPPKINPWKTRAEQSNLSRPAISQPVSQPQPAVKETSSSHLSTTENSNGHAQAIRRTHRPSKSAAPAIDDATLWPTLDKALGESSDLHRKPATSDSTENNAASAPRITGKEKWTKYTPTIIHAPIPSKSNRGAANSQATKNAGRGGSSQRISRERLHSDKSDVGVESSSKQSRSSETSQSRSAKGRSMSVSNPRSERLPRRETQTEVENNLSTIRSHSSKRSDRGSVSAPTGNTPILDASKSPQVPSTNGTYPDSVSPPETRVHRGSYDSNISTRPRGGGYRGTRGNYQNSYNTRYQNPANFAAQPHVQTNRLYQREQMPYGFDQYQNFVNPAIAPMMLDPMVARHMVLNQCEYYFSIENLCKDMFLRKHMDSQGYVNLPILASFNRVRSITLDYALIRDVCVMSTLIELREVAGSYDKIRRVEGWEQWVLPEDQRDPSTQAVPDAVSEIPLASSDDAQGDMSSNIGARAFVPGQSTHHAQSGTTLLNENFANLGIGRKLSPEVRDFDSQKTTPRA